jgi:hypothetical protein
MFLTNWFQLLLALLLLRFGWRLTDAAFRHYPSMDMTLYQHAGHLYNLFFLAL